MGVRIHTLNAAGFLTATSPAGGDDDGAPPALPPGARVTTVDSGGELVGESSSSPTEERLAAAREAAMQQAINPPIKLAAGEVNYVGPLPPSTRRDTVIAAALVEKFPAFDPAWPPKVKSAWFSDFRELMSIVREG